jgi:hypothetical protein
MAFSCTVVSTITRSNSDGLSRLHPDGCFDHGDGAQQPADVEAGRAQHGVQRVALAAFEPAATHTVVVLGMTDRRLGLD